MNPSRIFQVARKNLLELVREPQSLGLLLLFPLFMMLITAVGYGTRPRLPTYSLQVINQHPDGARLVAALQAERYPDGRPVFAITPSPNRAAAEEALKAQQSVILLIFAPDADGKLALTVRGDAMRLDFTRCSVELDRRLSPALDALSARPQRVLLTEQPIALHAPQTEFDAYTPGMMIFAILMLIPQAALVISRERRNGLLNRLRLTAVTSVELLSGISLALMVVAAAQVLVLFATARLFGFHQQGSLLLGILICLLLSFSAVGMGLVVAGFTENDSQSLNTGSTVSMLQVFLSGAFFAMPDLPVFSLGGYSIGAFDFLPATHAMTALQQVLVSGANLPQVAFRLGMAALLSLVYFAAGIIFFRSMLWRR